jgi:hypothetical protein
MRKNKMEEDWINEWQYIYMMMKKKKKKSDVMKNEPVGDQRTAND